MFGRRRFFVALLLSCLVPAGIAAQGMGSTTRAARKSNIKTDLPPIQVDFRDIAAEAGLTAKNVSGNPDRKSYIIETTGNGVVLFDFDDDGLVDIFLPNGSTLEPDGEKPPLGTLYRNQGDLRFEDVTAEAGLEQPGWGQGACAADYDNDGRRDLFVALWGQSRLFHNEGGGRFKDVTDASGLTRADIRWDTGCSFFDYDLDGKLDLVVTGYLDFDEEKIPKPGANPYCRWQGVPVMCGPRSLPFTKNLLFHNEGDGRFRDVSQSSGIQQAEGCYGFTAVTSDFTGDGYPDVYVACDSTPSLLYENNRDGTFTESGIIMGVALNEDGQEQGGMGVAVGDFDEDGRFDILKTNFANDIPNAYHNTGDAFFEDRVYQAGLGGNAKYVGWGIDLLDVDHDGLDEVFIVNGHVYPEIVKNPALEYHQSRQLYWNVGGGKFIEITEEAGPAVKAKRSSRGLASGDLDNDGSLEVVITNMGEPPSLLKNFGPRRNWLLVDLEGVQANRDAVGARVAVQAGGRRLTDEVRTGASYLSQHDHRLHFGLGDAETYDAIIVRWPGGAEESFPGGKAGRVVQLRQGAGRKPAE